MASACCCHYSCPCERFITPATYTQETRNLQPQHTASIVLATNMDIAVLKEQYNSIKEKQRLETRVIFREGKKKLDLWALVGIFSMKFPEVWLLNYEFCFLLLQITFNK